MHLLESYALSAGQKIDKIQIMENYYPLDIKEYVTFQPFSKGAKSYDYFNDVLAPVIPALHSRGIQIVQIGGPNEQPFPGCFHTQGTTNIGQVAYIIKNAKLHFGVDSFGAHLAGHYNIPLVSLYSNNYINCVKPYFGDTKYQILLEPDRTNLKPSFALEEYPKQINKIKPELIASSILKLLGFKTNIQFESLYFGEAYTRPIIEVIFDQIINPKQLNIQSLIGRMDLHFNEENLFNQLKLCKVCIVTDKPIDIEKLKAFKGQITEIVYIVTENDNPQFAASASKLGIPFHLISYLNEEGIKNKKINYIDIGIIHSKKRNKPEELKEISSEKLFFKSNRFLLSNNKIYLSKAHWLTGKSIPNFNQNFSSIIDSNDFWNESEYFYINKKV